MHDSDKSHYFSSEEHVTVREWMKALMKATITRDYAGEPYMPDYVMHLMQEMSRSRCLLVQHPDHPSCGRSGNEPCPKTAIAGCSRSHTEGHASREPKSTHPA